MPVKFVRCSKKPSVVVTPSRARGFQSGQRTGSYTGHPGEGYGWTVVDVEVVVEVDVVVIVVAGMPSISR